MPQASTYHQSKVQIDQDAAHIRAAQNDPARFEPLYDKYYGQILQFVYQRLNDKETAYDVAAQVFYVALNHIEKYEFRGLPFSAWLYRIAINELNQYFRSKKADRTINIDVGDLGDMMGEVDETGIIAEDKRAFESMQRKMIDAIAQLEEDEVQLLEMRYFEKIPVRDVSHILGITESNVKVKVHRIIKKLKNLIGTV